MKEKETSKGVLKYRMPNVPECFDILAALTDEIGKPVAPMVAKKKIMEISVEMLDETSVGYESKQDMINDPENMLMPISEIADEFYKFASSALEKKKE